MYKEGSVITTEEVTNGAVGIKETGFLKNRPTRGGRESLLGTVLNMNDPRVVEESLGKGNEQFQPHPDTPYKYPLDHHTTVYPSLKVPFRHRVLVIPPTTESNPDSLHARVDVLHRWVKRQEPIRGLVVTILTGPSVPVSQRSKTISRLAVSPLPSSLREGG